jgi:hypothetical protein
MINTLYATGAVTASLDVRSDGRIIGLAYFINTAATGNFELTFNSSPSYTTNDTTGVIAGGPLIANTALDGYIAFDEPVEAGERLFLHQTGVGNITRLMIYSDAKGGRRNVRRA